jgi:hypothetical protein
VILFLPGAILGTRGNCFLGVVGDFDAHNGRQPTNCLYEFRKGSGRDVKVRMVDMFVCTYIYGPRRSRL